MNTFNYYRHYLTITVSHIPSNNNVLTIKGVWLPPDPHFRPSSLPLIKDPHKEPSTTMLVFIVKSSRKPLNKFGKPSRTLIIQNIQVAQSLLFKVLYVIFVNIRQNLKHFIYFLPVARIVLSHYFPHYSH